MPLWKKPIKHFIAMWDRDGLECIFDLTEEKEKYVEWEKSAIVSILKEEDNSAYHSNIPIKQMVLRATLNSQREYEIYEFEYPATTEDVKTVFSHSPESIKDIIRRNGYKIYGDGVTA